MKEKESTSLPSFAINFGCRLLALVPSSPPVVGTEQKNQGISFFSFRNPSEKASQDKGGVQGLPGVNGKISQDMTSQEKGVGRRRRSVTKEKEIGNEVPRCRTQGANSELALISIEMRDRAFSS